jgi:hypothetical protein
MKSLKLIGLSLMAFFALGSFAASAYAEEGFLVGGNTTPTTALLLGGKSTYATESEPAAISCPLLDSTTITFSNDKHGKAVLHWLKCTILGFEAHSLGAKEGEILVPVLFLVCLDAKNAAGTLVDAFGVSGEVEGTAHIESPVIGSLVELKGAMLGAILTSGKATLFNVEFLGKEGKQTVTKCLEGANEKVHNLLVSTNHGTFKAASENVEIGLIQFPASTELMDS